MVPPDWHLQVPALKLACCKAKRHFHCWSNIAMTLPEDSSHAWQGWTEILAAEVISVTDVWPRLAPHGSDRETGSGKDMQKIGSIFNSAKHCYFLWSETYPYADQQPWICKIWSIKVQPRSIQIDLQDEMTVFANNWSYIEYEYWHSAILYPVQTKC